MNNKSYIVFPLRRIAASIYDLFLLLGVWFLVGSIALGIKYFFTGEVSSLNPNIGMSLVIFSTWFFYSYFWLNGGKTLGMAVWKFEIYSLDNNKIGLKHVSIRFFINLVTFLLAGIPLLLMYVSKKKLSISDHFSRTSYRKI
ncbi:MAG: RDD family protein [Gammaproteobacteria bacterium TMED226]|nr:MAG: RDD family protein [Gammaproteobacteria bacterium TMED226]|tara:strand:- start:3899 stop:4324 length:426 start_codon:yes stop_codon:yes gene_type:complete